MSHYGVIVRFDLGRLTAGELDGFRAAVERGDVETMGDGLAR